MKVKKNVLYINLLRRPNALGAAVFLLPFHFATAVHKDVTERLSSLDPELWEQVKSVLELNLKERHLRGGDATKRKYAEKKRDRGDETIFS